LFKGESKILKIEKNMKILHWQLSIWLDQNDGGLKWGLGDLPSEWNNGFDLFIDWFF